MEKVNLFDISFDFFHLIMIFMRVQIGNHTGNGSSRQSATGGGDNGGGSSSGGGRKTSDDEEEEEPVPRPETNRTKEGKNKRQRTGIPDQSKEYFGVAMEKMASTFSSVVASAINSSGAVGNKDREYEQQRRERAESQLREFELKQKLSDQRRAVEEEVAVKYKIDQKEAAVKYRELEAKFQEMSLSKVVVIVFFIW